MFSRDMQERIEKLCAYVSTVINNHLTLVVESWTVGEGNLRRRKSQADRRQYVT